MPMTGIYGSEIKNFVLIKQMKSSSGYDYRKRTLGAYLVDTFS